MRNFRIKKNLEERVFHMIWKSIGEKGALRHWGNGEFDIIVGFRKGYEVMIKRFKGDKFVVSLNYTYCYGFKNFNTATIEDIVYIVLDDYREINKALYEMGKIVSQYINCRMNNRDDMLKEQERTFTE